MAVVVVVVVLCGQFVVRPCPFVVAAAADAAESVCASSLLDHAQD